MQSAEQHIRRVTWTGLVANVLLSALKFMAGVMGHSQTLMADAFHSLSDSITDVAILVGSHFWARPPDEAHPYGHRRLETMVTLFIGSLLLAAGIGLGWRAVLTLRSPSDVHPGYLALAVAGVSVLIKEAMYRWSVRVGRKYRSTALMANAWHHRLDALSSIPAFLAVGGAILVPQWHFLDHIGAIVVCTLIVQAALGIMRPCLKELIDTGAAPAILAMIRQIAEDEEGVVEVHAIRTRYISSGLHVDLHMVVDGAISVRCGHDIADNVQRRLQREVPDVQHIVVHTEPDEGTRRPVDRGPEATD